MIDPNIALAYSIYSNKGLYALLIGSGVSRSAGIPTGWEVVLDLTRKLAYMEGDENPSDPAEWYRRKYQEEPDYSKLLKAIARTPDERQQLLSGYFEPTEEEREAKLKLPTEGHRAIASLVVNGFVKVILTTNFDRLIEQEIESQGMAPVVLSTTDAIKGAKPMVHQQCTVIKLHGDYLDPRIKNTPEELSLYDDELNVLLDRVVDEYGIIVCGWSGEWDVALRAAFDRAPNRRFPMYWAARSAPGAKAKELTQRRDAVFVKIADADSFFDDLATRVEALENLHQPHPLSVASAASVTKRFLSEPKYSIKLHDLVHQETERVYARLQTEFQGFTGYFDTLPRAVDQYWSITEILRVIGMNIAYFSDEASSLLVRCVLRLTNDPTDDLGGTKPVDFTHRAIPSLMLLYTSGIAACANNRGQTVCAVAKAMTLRKYEQEQPYLVAVDWPDIHKIFHHAREKSKELFPVSEWFYERCKTSAASLVSDPSAFERQFDRFEVLLSLAFLNLDPEVANGISAWAPLGRFAYKHRRTYQAKFLNEIAEDDGIVRSLLEEEIYSSKQEVEKAKDILIDVINRRGIY